MTAPESSPKPAAAAIAEIRQRYADSSRHLVNWWDSDIKVLLLEIQRLESAAIQRGDGQTDVLKALEVAHDGLEAAKEIAADSRVQDSYWDGVRDCIKVSDAAVCKTIASLREANQPIHTIPPAAKPNETSGATPIVVTVSPGEKPMSAETGTAIKEMVTLAAMQVQLSGADKALEIERAHVARLQAELNAVRAAGAELPPVLTMKQDFAEIKRVKSLSHKDLVGEVTLRRLRYEELHRQLDERDAAKSTPGVDRYSYHVLVFEPQLTHSVWKDWGSDDCLSHEEVLDLLREGVEKGEYVGWRVVTEHKRVLGRDDVALAKLRAKQDGAGKAGGMSAKTLPIVRRLKDEGQERAIRFIFAMTSESYGTVHPWWKRKLLRWAFRRMTLGLSVPFDISKQIYKIK